MKAVWREIAYYLESGNRKEAAHVSREIDVWFPYGNMRGIEEMENEQLDEFNTRLRFCRRDVITMTNAGKDDNGLQFFFTLSSTLDLQNKHTIFEFSPDSIILCNEKFCYRDFDLLSFGEEAEEDEEESVILNKKFSANKKWKKDRSRDWECYDGVKTPEELEVIKKEKKAMKERIKSKLRNTKKEPRKIENYKIDNDEDDEDIEENE
ncbi:Peptidyl-prolyl cis-trans isomerase CWC27 like protein [Eufriesea mexicana]|uniref:Spliceosome-associated protein CWC27 homolog n=1 Tax=Eufriesea mexicana TaxID=516756 RepID=A0A310SJR8_9HYME|nr:Peptidyl-prolyl cis-trans isomerase CWC27 like protein [Eufriesea mexicana]